MILHRSQHDEREGDRQGAPGTAGHTPAPVREFANQPTRNSESPLAPRSKRQFTGNTEDRKSWDVTIISKIQSGENNETSDPVSSVKIQNVERMGEKWM